MRLIKKETREKNRNKLAGHGLEINPNKSEAVSVCGDGRVRTVAEEEEDPTDRLAQPLVLRDGSTIRWLRAEDQSRYLGANIIGGGRFVDGGEGSKVRLDTALNNIKSAPITPQLKLLCLKQVALPRQLHSLTMEPGNNDCLKMLDRSVRKSVGEWLALPGSISTPSQRGARGGDQEQRHPDEDRLESHLYREERKGGLGIMRLAEAVPRIQHRKLEKLRRLSEKDVTDPVFGATAHSRQWDGVGPGSG